MRQFKFEFCQITVMALNFSIERLVQTTLPSSPQKEEVEESQSRESDDERAESVKTEEEADSTTTPDSVNKDAASYGTAMSYFDMLLPHMQMASSNPLLSSNNDSSSSATQLRLWSQQWLELLQQSTNSQLGDVAAAGLFLQPFRKHKRIRTAFSPAQLVQLEKAFLANHYVVGTERKQLASRLNLSETQVKVWFQNRRTKHKRIKLDGSVEEIPSKDGSPASPVPEP
ncbi:hypothetical protein PMAYCL1PPCAC_21807 [Pristionchus mayeri]|uniref:Homeobox domain-containing protein n=1 Tax=Pristionchus mayeri TaxID=1317129 RepID=A0AAN5I485_9BILA|nr:hypothetical protein PMAYCL1PPCAC_21807 [Pristionchus mayeri]